MSERTIDAAVSTVTILKHLSSETADAHTRLISRLLGVTADVRKLSEGLRDSISGSNSSNINDQLTSEANRLALLAEMVDNTVDADAVNPDLSCLAIPSVESRRRLGSRVEPGRC